MTSDESPLEELIRISIETYSLVFEFTTYRIDIGAKFTLTLSDGSISGFDPPKQSGNLRLLWPLIGSMLEYKSKDEVITWKNAFSLVFTSGEILTVASSSTPRGTVIGKEFLSFDDF